jgi:hypothetical protein
MLLQATVLTLTIASAQGNVPRGFAPRFLYEKVPVEGFEVLLSPEVRIDDQLRSSALEHVGASIRFVLNVAPPDRLKSVLGMAIWIELEAPRRGQIANYFSIKATQLRELGVNPEKEKCVEISNVRHFVASHSSSKRAMLAALAVAILDRGLANAKEAVEATYKRAIEEKLYPSSASRDKLDVRLYPSAGTEEYFAALTLAHFGLSDFFPFNREELRAHDPRGAALMAEVWGPPR